jgi:dinuclear metal center YbgI/SA1388 family protein
MAIECEKLVHYLDETMQPMNFKDYCPNGLQVEGTSSIEKILFAVSATKETVEAAVEWGAQALVVHHGLFWKYQGAKPIVGPFAKRVKPLVQHNINLIAYHLPLDAQLDFGNASALAQALGLTHLKPFGDYKGAPLGVQGKFPKKMSSAECAEKIEKLLNHQVIHAKAHSDKDIHTMGIITGGANNEWPQALCEGLDSYLTGEISEYNWHDAIEADIHYFAAGHNATESLGIQALMKTLEKKFSAKIECRYFAINNPA